MMIKYDQNYLPRYITYPMTHHSTILAKIIVVMSKKFLKRLRFKFEKLDEPINIFCLTNDMIAKFHARPYPIINMRTSKKW